MLEIDLITEAEKHLGKTLEEEYGEELAGMVRRNYRRVIHLHTPPRTGIEGMKNSWLGGKPTLPDSIPWPVYRHAGVDWPMAFVMQLDCADVPQLEEYPFPKQGTLLFFYEFNFQTERSSSADEQNKGGKVIYLEDVQGVPLRERPSLPDATGSALDFVEEEDAEDWDTGARAPHIYEVQQIEPVISGVLEDEPPEFSASKETRQRLIKKYMKAEMFFNKVSDDLQKLHWADGKWGSHNIFGEVDTYAAKGGSSKYHTLLRFGGRNQFQFFTERVLFIIEKSLLKERDFSSVIVGEGT